MEEGLLFSIALASEPNAEPSVLSEGYVALETLMAKHEKFVYTATCKILSDKKNWGFDENDIYSRVLQKIWRSAESFNVQEGRTEEESFKTWVYQIAKNLVLDSIKAIKIDMDDREFEEIAQFMPREEQSEDSEIITEIRNVLESLPENYQEVLRALSIQAPLDDEEMRTNSEQLDELVQMLGITKANLRQRRRRAIKAFKMALEANPRLGYLVKLEI